MLQWLDYTHLSPLKVTRNLSIFLMRSRRAEALAAEAGALADAALFEAVVV